MQRRMTFVCTDPGWRGRDEDVIEMFAYSKETHQIPADEQTPVV